jgi:DNA repair protein RecO (recombination protein O)
MISWRAEGTLIAARRHGENAAIIDVFTHERGLHSGVVRGGAGRKLQPVLQPGNRLDLTWKARIEDHLGAFTVEPIETRIARIMTDRRALAGLNAICGLIGFALAERHPYPDLYERTEILLDLLGQEDSADVWPLAYLRWELALLDDLGFGLDLSHCVVTGARENLTYISPKSGCAVSEEGAGDWASRLLPLPLVLLGQGAMTDADIAAGLQVTGHFLTEHLTKSLGDRPLPASRRRLLDVF